MTFNQRRDPPARTFKHLPVLEAITRARAQYGSDDIVIDDNAETWEAHDNSGTWVAAVVWVANDPETT